MSGSVDRLIVLAIGGNSLITDGEHRSVQDQYLACRETCRQILELIQQGHRLIITHGNGPQVGFILRRSELARGELHEVPLDSCVADTQGAIGYQIQRSLANLTRSWPNPPAAATVVTQVEVLRDDPSFGRPTKPIGSFLTAEQAEERRARDGWTVVEDAGRGYRRAVACPRPVRILEMDAIRHLLAAGVLVVAAGGGGIPVVEQPDGSLVGVEAVIDKDRASSLLARVLGADLLVISTSVEKVCIHYRTPQQRALDRITAAEAQAYLAAGHFAPGSMRPKIEAALSFADSAGGSTVITDPDHLAEAVEGRGGTWIVP